MTTPATTQELIADVLLSHLPNDDDAYTAADAILRDPGVTVRKRNVINRGESRDVAAALDALPIGTQIRWRATGPQALPTLGIKIENIMGHQLWSTTGLGNLKSIHIAFDNTPIEVLA